MKTKFWIIACLSLFACVTAASANSTTIFAIESGGVFTLTYSQSALRSEFETEFGDGTNVDTVYVETFTDSYNVTFHYLVAKGKLDTNSHNMSIQLVGDQNGNYRTVAVRHTCSGFPCSECKFTRTDGGGISGCSCESWCCMCNHSQTGGARLGGHGVGSLP